MTKTDLQWLAMKRAELLRAYAIYGEKVNRWDLPRFMEIIDSQIKQLKHKNADR